MKKLAVFAFLAAASLLVVVFGASSTTQPSVTFTFDASGHVASIVQTMPDGSTYSPIVAPPSPPSPPLPPIGPAITMPGSPIPTSGPDVYLLARGNYQQTASLNLKGVTIHGNGANLIGDGAGDAVVNSYGSAGKPDVVDEVNFLNNTAPGAPEARQVQVYGVGAEFTNCTSGYCDYFFYVAPSAVSTLIENCVCPTLDEYEVYSDYAVGTDMENCTFGSATANTGSARQHLVRGGGKGTILNHCTLFQPNTTGQTGFGQAKNAINAQLGDWTITNNTVGTVGRYSGGVWLGTLGPALESPMTSITFTGNTVINTFTDIEPQVPVVNVSNNVFKVNSAFAISIQPNVGTVNISNNIGQNTGTAGGFVFGLASPGAVNLTGNNYAASAISGTNWNESGNYWFVDATQPSTSAGNTWALIPGVDVAGWHGVNGAQMAETREQHLAKYPTDRFVVPTTQPVAMQP